MCCACKLNISEAIPSILRFILQKLESRKAILLKTNSLKDAQQDLWKKVVVKDSFRVKRVAKKTSVTERNVKLY